MVSNFLRFVNTKGSSLPAHGKGGARATSFLAALFAKQKTKFGGGGKARGPAQQQAVCGINSAPSEAGNQNFTNWLSVLNKIRTFFRENPDADF